jgi:xyloglucan-specific exo-beta-1,4-glucanase
VRTFYAYNSGVIGPGIYKSTDGGASFAITAVARHLDAYDRFNAQMRSVPGKAGNFYYTSGSNTAKRTQHFWECKDSGAVTCSPVLGVTDVWSFGFGKEKPSGSGYPSIFIYGAVKSDFGLWRSDDHHLTWVKLSGKFLNNSQDQVRVVEGDNNVYGTVYIGFGDSGLRLWSAAVTAPYPESSQIPVNKPFRRS